MSLLTREAKLLIFKKNARLIVFVLFAFLLSNCDYLKSRDFKAALEQKNCAEAKNILLKSLKNNMDDENSKFNLIHAFVCSGDLDSANKQIDALLGEDTIHKYELLFLKGYILGEMGDIDEALFAYQSALNINADVKIKQNMELLLKEERSGKSGKKKKNKNKKQNESDPNDKGQDDQDQEQDDKDKKKTGQDKNQKENKSQPKKMNEKQVEKLMKEIDSDEKKIRSQGLKVKTKKGNYDNEKNW